MTQDELKAHLTLAGITALKIYELANQYWPVHPAYWKIRAESPWWLVKTQAGLLVVGARKRVVVLDWSDTAIRKIITADDTTKEETLVHALTPVKFQEYLNALAVEIAAATAVASK